MGSLFVLTGRIAIIMVITAGFSGIFGAWLRKRVKGTWVFKIHRGSGICAIVSGIAHGLIYFLYLS